ncbi:MAG: hypothetical protein ACRDGV_11415 [Candidatus Limnocylindria bacterium]
MTASARLVVVALVLGAGLVVLVLVAFASRACPVETARLSCPSAAANVTVVVGLASIAVTLLVTPFAFLAEFVARRRIVYRGAWWRAARRAVLAGLVIAVLAGLRLGGALSVPVVIFVAVLAVLIERFLASRDP